MPTLPELLTTSLTFDDLIQALGAQQVELLCLRRLVQTLEAEVAAFQGAHADAAIGDARVQMLEAEVAALRAQLRTTNGQFILEAPVCPTLPSN